MLRSNESNVAEIALGLPITKKASYFDRVNFGCKKIDPFEGKATGDIWKVEGDKLLRKAASETVKDNPVAAVLLAHLQGRMIKIIELAKILEEKSFSEAKLEEMIKKFPGIKFRSKSENSVKNLYKNLMKVKK
jgi:hypothetical protein